MKYKKHKRSQSIIGDGRSEVNYAIATSSSSGLVHAISNHAKKSLEKLKCEDEESATSFNQTPGSNRINILRAALTGSSEVLQINIFRMQVDYNVFKDLEGCCDLTGDL